MKKDKNYVIKFSNVSKKFKRGRKLLLKEALVDIFKPGVTEEFWALKNISFQVPRGETLGIIGPNGSGKSTILKLIAGVMVPNGGSIDVNGEIAPLIEIGAGFHPELTGRENIYLNGSILGLKKEEINNRFDEIVSFAELAEFIDTPVKHYSSGMYVRLGFSIAINTKPDILLVDEILSVGDESFRKRCMMRMKDFQKGGTTIVFVSHNLDTVRSFCSRVIHIEQGNIESIGDPSDVIGVYVAGIDKE